MTQTQHSLYNTMLSAGFWPSKARELALGVRPPTPAVRAMFKGKWP